MSRFRPNVTVACVIQAKQRFLLVEEIIEGQTRLNQPAGHLESGESLLQACQREVVEETGLIVSPHSLLTVNQWLSPSGIQFLRFCFVADLENCLPAKPQDPQIRACHWLTREQITQHKQQHRSPLVQQSFDDYDKGVFMPLSLLKSDLSSR